MRDAHWRGVNIADGADHNVVEDIEATNVGIGIAVYGQHNLITQNHVHNLHIIKNTPGGDDDFGAVGTWLFNSNNEVSYNRMVNCIAPSHDYGTDGGVVEWFGNVDNCYVHHNWGIGCDGFLEISGGSAKNTIVAYNVSINNGGFAWLHLDGGFASEVENFRAENNTIVETEDYGEMKWIVFGFNGVPSPNTFLARNNIFHVNDFWFISDANRRGWNFTHEYNLYYLANPETELAFSLGEGEQIADPVFVDLAGQDFHLQPGSPAIDTGINLGYLLDFAAGTDGSVVISDDANSYTIADAMRLLEVGELWMREQ